MFQRDFFLLNYVKNSLSSFIAYNISEDYVLVSSRVLGPKFVTVQLLAEFIFERLTANTIFLPASAALNSLHLPCNRVR